MTRRATDRDGLLAASSLRRRIGPSRPFAVEDAEQHMVLPAAVDAEIFLGVALFTEAVLHQDGAAGAVVRQAGGLDTMQLEAAEGEAEGQRQRLGHVALAGEFLPHPLAETARFRDA